MIRHILKLTWARKRSNALLIVEVFFSFLVLYGVAVLAVLFFSNSRHPLGFEWQNVWTISVDRPGAEEKGDTLRMDQVLRTIRAQPDVRALTRSQFLPFTDVTFEEICVFGGRRAKCSNNTVGDDYASVLGMKVISGRWFSREDAGQSWMPVVINRKLQNDLFDGEDAIGREITMDFEPGRRFRVVGVVEEYREDGEYGNLAGFMLRRATENDWWTPNILVALNRSDPAGFEHRLVQQLQRTAPQWSFTVRPLSDVRSSHNRYKLLGLQITGTIAAFLMLMVALGLCGVLWQSVTRRAREFGLRRAIGASAANVRLQVLAELALVVSFGVTLGIVLGVQFPLLGMLDFISVQTYAIAMVVAMAVIYAIAFLAGLYPSWLTTRIQPSTALHYE